MSEEKKKRPQDRWNEKAGLASKTYKVDKTTALEFQEACRERGVAIGTQIMKMMREFVDEK